MNLKSINKLLSNPTFICLSFFLLSLLLYSKTFTFDFVNYDDQTILLNNSHLFGNNNFIEGLKAIFTYFPREEPLIIRDISWLIDIHFFGFPNPTGFHVGNVFLNAVNTSLLFCFLYLSTNRITFSALSSLLFLTLPIHVEPVCWIMGRKDLLSTFFMFIVLISQSLILKSSTKFTTYVFFLYILTIVFTLLATLSKINSIIIFLVLASHRLFWPYLQTISFQENGRQFLHRLKKYL